MRTGDDKVDLASTVLMTVVFVVVAWCAWWMSGFLMMGYIGCLSVPDPCSSAAGYAFTLVIPILGIVTLLAVFVDVILRGRRRVSTWWIPSLGLVLMVVTAILNFIVVSLTGDL